MRQVIIVFMLIGVIQLSSQTTQRDTLSAVKMSGWHLDLHVGISQVSKNRRTTWGSGTGIDLHRIHPLVTQANGHYWGTDLGLGFDFAGKPIYLRTQRGHDSSLKLIQFTRSETIISLHAGLVRGIGTERNGKWSGVVYSLAWQPSFDDFTLKDTSKQSLLFGNDDEYHSYPNLKKTGYDFNPLGLEAGVCLERRPVSPFLHLLLLPKAANYRLTTWNLEIGVSWH